MKKEVYKHLTKNIDDWEINQFEAYHKPSGLIWWIGNGLLFFSFRSIKNVSIGLFYSIKLYYWIKNANRIKIINNKL